MARERIALAASEGFSVLNEEDLFLLQWYGLFPQKDEPDLWVFRFMPPMGQLASSQLKWFSKKLPSTAFLNLTARQSVQVEGIASKDLEDWLSESEAAGLFARGAGGDTVRNIVTCPVAGLDGRELFDVSGLVRDLSVRFHRNPDFVNLPRKLKVSIAACPEQCQQPEIHCVSFVGALREQDGEKLPGFDLWVGGGLSGSVAFAQRLGGWLPADQAVPVLEAIAGIYRNSADCRTNRDRARLRHLIADWGIERFKTTLQERLSFPLEDVPVPVDPLESVRDHLGVREEKESGFFYASVFVPSGRLTVPQLKKLADIVDRYGDGTARVTPRKNLIIPHLLQERVAQVLEGLDSVGLKTQASSLLRGMNACPGADSCTRAQVHTRGRLEEWSLYLKQQVLLSEPVSIHFSGCQAQCAQDAVAGIGIQGRSSLVDGKPVELFDLFAGGQLGARRRSAEPVAHDLPSDQVPLAIERLLMLYKKKRQPGESFSDYCARVGVPLLKEAAVPPVAAE